MIDLNFCSIYLNNFAGATTKWGWLWYIYSLLYLLFSRNRRTGCRFEQAGASRISNFMQFSCLCLASVLLNCFFLWRFRFKDALFNPEELKNLEDIRKDIHSYREYVYPAVFFIYFLCVKLWPYILFTSLQENGCRNCRVGHMARLHPSRMYTYLLLGKADLTLMIRPFYLLLRSCLLC